MSATSTSTADRTVNTRSHPVGSEPVRRRLRGLLPPERSTVDRGALDRGTAGRRAPADGEAADVFAPLAGFFAPDFFAPAGAPLLGDERDDPAPLDGRGAGGRDAGGTG